MNFWNNIEYSIIFITGGFVLWRVLVILGSSKNNPEVKGRRERKQQEKVRREKESVDDLSHPDIEGESHSKILYFVVGLLLIGITYGWFDSDKVVSYLQVRDGIRYEVNSETPFTGRKVIYFENGQKRFEGNYKDGKEDGPHNAWHKNGQKSSEGNWKNGWGVGTHTRWFDNGQKDTEGKYKNGLYEGIHTRWNRNGEVFWKLLYKRGRVVKTIVLPKGIEQ
jgi:hypothetical protein